MKHLDELTRRANEINNIYISGHDQCLRLFRGWVYILDKPFTLITFNNTIRMDDKIIE